MSSSETRPSTVLFPLVHHSGAFNKAPSLATVRAALNPKHGHKLETCRGRLVEYLDGVRGGRGRGGGRDRLKGSDYSIAHKVGDRAVEAENEVVLGGPPCGYSGVSIKGVHGFVG